MKLKNYSLALAALLFFINGACSAQAELPQLPDTPAGNQAKGWLEVFNAGDPQKRREFLQKNYPSRLERFDRETEMRRGNWWFRRHESCGVDTNQDHFADPGTPG
jgi:hypothetical protein